MSLSVSAQDVLLDRFVSGFEKADEMIAHDNDPVAQELALGEADEYGFRRWRAKKVEPESSMLDAIYSRVPARFPPLYERLVLTYRWAQVHLPHYTLLANPPGSDLRGLLGQMSKDKIIWPFLSHRGYIQFSKGPDMDYDPVCFDLSSRKKGGEYRIVKIDHEEILCNDRLRIVSELAPTFEQLVLKTIEQAGT